MKKQLKTNFKTKAKIKDALIFVAPFFLIYTVFFIGPLVFGLYYSFTDWNLVSDTVNFVGLDNYQRLFTQDDAFFDSIEFTLRFTLWNVLFTNIIAMLLALALSKKRRFTNFFRASIFIPYMISMVVSGFVWMFMFNKVSNSLYEKTGFFLFDVNWLTDENVVLISVLILSLWHGVGYVMTIFIAGIQGIDDSLLEAAELDGANAWVSFFRIKLPIMLPTVAIGIFLNVSGSLKIFDTVMSLTGGGPNRATESVMINIYQEAFLNRNFGYGTAKATIWSIFIIIIALIQFRVTSQKEVEH